MATHIAERKLLYSVKGDGVRQPFSVRLYAPKIVREEEVGFYVGEEGCSACRIEIIGIDEPHQVVYGADSLQAVALASDAVEALLRRLQKKYDLYLLNGEAYF